MTNPELSHFDPTADPRYAFGLAGLAVSILGLILAVARPHVDDAAEPPPPIPAKIGDQVVDAADKFVGRMIDRARGKPNQPAAPAPKVLPWRWYLAVAGPALGLLGAMAGLIGWVRHELPRPTVAAMVVGFLAVAWIYLLVALVITFVIVAAVLILGHIG